MKATVNSAAAQPVGGPAGQALPVAAGIFAEITAGLSDGSELETLLGRFLVPIVRLAGAQAGLVRTLSDDGEQMRLVGDIGLPEDVRLSELSVDRHCGACGVAADQDVITWAADLQSCAQHQGGGGYFGQLCRRMLAVPLRHRGELLGIYNLFFDTDAELGADIQAMLRSIGELLGLALHNARLERANLCTTVMNERRFLASEVHDSIAQSLVYVNMRLPLLQDAMLAHDDERSLRYWGEVKQAVTDVQANLREILVNFRTSMDPQGLLSALKGMAAEFPRRTGMELEFNCAVHDLGLSAEQEVQVFHITQESLANVCRHACASQVWLGVQEQDGQLEVVIEDDGQGLPTLDAPEGHYGLAIMKERAERLGGSVEVGPRHPSGTRVRLRLPRQMQRSAQEVQG